MINTERINSENETCVLNTEHILDLTEFKHSLSKTSSV